MSTCPCVSRFAQNKNTLGRAFSRKASVSRRSLAPTIVRGNYLSKRLLFRSFSNFPLQPIYKRILRKPIHNIKYFNTCQRFCAPFLIFLKKSFFRANPPFCIRARPYILYTRAPAAKAERIFMRPAALLSKLFIIFLRIVIC